MVRGSPSATFPLSRPFDVGHVGPEGTAFTVTASPEERAALARMNGLVAIDDLVAHLDLSREGRGGVRVTGTVDATISQTCVVTLDVFEAELHESVDVHFVPEQEIAATTGRTSDTEDAGVDRPDAIVGGRIDLGAVAAEFLALALDPYPRKPGVVFDEGAQGRDKDPSPFAALSRLRTERPH